MGAPDQLADYAAKSDSTLPPDLAQFAVKAAAPPAAPQRSVLSDIGLKEGPDVPITDHAHATLNGLQSIGRGIRGAVTGLYDTIRHPIDTAKSLAELPGQVAQVPAAIHDINQSPDPTGTYLKTAQDTAGQGAGQALVALGTEGIGRAVPKVAPPVIRTVARGTNVVLKRAPGMLGAAAGEAFGHPVLGYAIGKAVLPEIRVPGEEFGLPKPVYPGAHLPETPAPELSQASSLWRGSRIARDPAEGLGRIPLEPTPSISNGDPAPPEAEAPPPISSGDPILDRLREYAARIEADGHGDELPAPEETAPQSTNLNQDLTAALKASLKKVRAAKRIANSKASASIQ